MKEIAFALVLREAIQTGDKIISNEAIDRVGKTYGKVRILTTIMRVCIREILLQLSQSLSLSSLQVFAIY